MRKIMLTAAGLSSVALCTAALADADIAFEVSGPGGNFVEYSVDMSGTLGDASLVLDFTNNGGFTWAGDLLIGFIDPNGGTVEYGGYNLTFGYPTAGDFPSSWDSSSSGTYGPFSFSLAGFGVEGSGSWTVQFADGYSGGSSADHFTGTLTLVGMGGGGDPYGGCCMGTDCSTGTQADCGRQWRLVISATVPTVTVWPCGGAPEGACCFGTDCIDSDILRLRLISAARSPVKARSCCRRRRVTPKPATSVPRPLPSAPAAIAFDTSTATDSGYGEPDDLQCEGTFLDWDGQP